LCVLTEKGLTNIQYNSHLENYVLTETMTRVISAPVPSLPLHASEAIGLLKEENSPVFYL